MTPRKPAPAVVVAPEPWVLSSAQLAAHVGRSEAYVTQNLVYADGTKAAAKDVPAQVDGSEKPTVFFDLGGGVYLACWRRPNGGICFYRQHAEAAIAEAHKRWTHPSTSGR